MKRILNTVIALVFASAMSAQSVSEMFVSMPDSLLPYIGKQQRTELLSLKALDGSADAVLQNLFQEDMTLSFVADNRLVMNPNGKTMMELLRLDAETDSVYMLLKTVEMPERETSCAIYDNKWNKLGNIDFDEMELTSRPDTMTEKDYEDLLKLMEFRLVEVHSASEYGYFTAQLNVPLTTSEERDRLKAILLQRKLKWNGLTLK